MPGAHVGSRAARIFKALAEKFTTASTQKLTLWSTRLANFALELALLDLGAFPLGTRPQLSGGVSNSYERGRTSRVDSKGGFGETLGPHSMHASLTLRAIPAPARLRRLAKGHFGLEPTPPHCTFVPKQTEAKASARA